MRNTTMAGRIAFVGGADSETIQRLFAAVAADLKAEGVKVAGALAEAPPLPDSTCSAGLLRTLGIGEAYSITWTPRRPAPLATSMREGWSLPARLCSATCAAATSSCSASSASWKLSARGCSRPLQPQSQPERRP
ncbi:DUF2478 domain-containing protein [Mesorhizobium composti]|uniref:DUF2478 domain-containing protein n=1 Tax=Ollibium composti TaxID=2675109 RepID=A0ABY2QA11_9HYPH|nr:DUF2478 domain-containing protein [Mesorhizobium composti]